MRSDRFDHLTATFAQSVSRRGFIRSLAGLTGLLAAPTVRQAAAQSCAEVRGLSCANDDGCFPFDCPGFLCCGGVCTTIANDPRNCGGCGLVCSAVEQCIDGRCESACPGGRIPCGDSCVDPATDANNCGGCRDACPEGMVCRDAVCVAPCDAGQTLCGDRCVNLNRNDGHCGACGNVCPAGTACTRGECVSACGEGETFCSGACVDLGRDDANCGECGKRCRGGRVCRGGDCVSPCEAGLTLCNGSCVDLGTDERNCGECGESCPAGLTCLDGACTLVCSAPETRCGDICTDTTVDARNCGACGQNCPPEWTCFESGCLYERTYVIEETVRNVPGIDACTATPRSSKNLRSLVARLEETPASTHITAAEADAQIAGMQPADPERSAKAINAIDSATGCANGGDVDRYLGAVDDDGALQALREQAVRPRDKKIKQLLSTITPPSMDQQLIFLGNGEVFENPDTGAMLIRRSVEDPMFVQSRHQRLYRAMMEGDQIKLGSFVRVIPSDPPTSVEPPCKTILKVHICPPGMNETTFIGAACKDAHLERHMGHWSFYDEMSGSMQPFPAEPLFDDSSLTARSDWPMSAVGITKKWRGLVTRWALDSRDPDGSNPIWRLPDLIYPGGFVVHGYIFRDFGCSYTCPEDQMACDGYPTNEPRQPGQQTAFIPPADDPQNCGGCGLICPSGTSTCSGGICNPT